MPVESYGVWKATPVRYTYEGDADDSISPHLSLYFSDSSSGDGRAAINIKSGDRSESRLAYWTTSQFQHPLTEKLSALSAGFHRLSGEQQSRDGLALDFIRGNLFQRNTGRILPHEIPGPNNDILDQLKPILDRAIAASSGSNTVYIYIFGSEFGDGKGIHNVHMNQGNPARWSRDNGVFQDGGLLIQYPDGHWEGVFIGFASQAVHTEDGPGGDAGQPIPRTGYLTWANFLDPDSPGEDRGRDDLVDSPVVITSALVNPRGPDGQDGADAEWVMLKNRTDKPVDLGGWKVKNRTGQEQKIGDAVKVAGGKEVKVEVPGAPLSNKGGTITLLNSKGLKVHGVSYSKEQAVEGAVVKF